MAETVTQLGRYVPALLRARIAADPTPTTTAAQLSLHGALLFADVSGFSPLAERFGARGPAGAEAISSCLNTYFRNLIARIENHGGDVLKFAGDAVLAVWPTDTAETLATAAARAAQCGLEIQREMARVAVDDDVYLATRLGLGAGPVDLLLVGGADDRWETLPLGDPFRQLRTTHAQAHPGDLAVSPEAWQYLAGEFVGKPLGEGVFRVESALQPPQPVALVQAELAADVEPALRAWVPGVVLSRLGAGLTEWIGELRRVTVLFAGLPIASAADRELGRVQTIVRDLKTAVFRHDGTINKISVDDKGVVLVAVFGLPPLAHEDDSARTVQAALEIQRALKSHGMASNIGISTGQVFCGTVGSASRCEYTVLGHVVNLAARLMEAAKGRVLADAVTHELCSKTVDFERLPPVQVKGRAEPVAIFLPTGATRKKRTSRTPLVARLPEQAALNAMLQGLTAQRSNGTAVVIGEAGIGKSRLTDEIIQNAKDAGIAVHVGAGLPVERNIAYRPWRAVLEGLLALPLGDLVRRQELAQQALEPLGDLAGMAPLLESILPLGIIDNDRTRPLQGEARSRQTNALVCALLQHIAGQQPTMIVIEDAHWIDSASWRLLRDVQMAVKPVAILIATRPMPDPVPEVYPAICGEPGAQVLRLQGLGQQDAAQLAAQSLAVADIPAEVVTLIHARAGGNALYIEELAYVLRDNGCLAVDDGQCRMAVPVAQLAQTPLPATVEGLIVSRVDRLDARQQLALKCASVIDRLFPLDVLQGVYPNADERDQVPAMMLPLVTADMIRAEEAAKESYLFKHVLTQEAVYSLMLFAQRRALHRAVAQWYEDHDAGGRDYAVLAHHWQGAEEWPRAVQCLELAGDQALVRWASREAMTFFQRAQEIDRLHHIVQNDPLRHARWEWSIGEASFRLGRINEAEKSARTALQLAGRGVPASALGCTFGLLGQVAVRMLRRFGPRTTLTVTAKQRIEKLWATNILNRLTEINIYRENPPGLLDSAMRELNTAEEAGPSPELARAYAILTVVLATIPLAGICRAWAQRALDIAEATADPARTAYVLSRIGVYQICIADWSNAEKGLRRAAALARDFGDRRLRVEALSVLGYTLLYQGKLAEMEPVFAQVGVLAREADDAQVESWHHAGGGAGFLRQGRTALALEHLTKGVQYKATTGEMITTQGLFALANFRSGKFVEARKAADELYPLIAGKRPVAYWTHHGLSSLCATYCGLWDKAPAGSPQAAELAIHAKGLCAATVAFGKIFPLGVAQARLWWGCYLRRAGQTDAARQSLLGCVAIADERRQRYELGLAKRELALFADAGADEKRKLFGEALEILTDMGALFDAEEVRGQMGS